MEAIKFLQELLEASIELDVKLARRGEKPDGEFPSLVLARLEGS
jgi:hypothetical protein